MPLAVEALRAGYGDALVLDGLSLGVARGQGAALAGPNGSGKSTLLKAMARLPRPSGGAVLLDGSASARLPTAQGGRALAVLPQGPSGHR